MREKNRKTIEIEKMLPQFTTMNVIDGQAGLMSYSSLIFYSLTIDNILNIIVMLILVAVTITMAINGGLFENAGRAVGETQNELNKEQEIADEKIQIDGVWYDSMDDYINGNPSGEHNWTREGDTFTCSHCNLTCKMGEMVSYKPAGKQSTILTAEKSGIVGIDLNAGINGLPTNFTGNFDEEGNQIIEVQNNTNWIVLGIEDTNKDGKYETLLITTEYSVGATISEDIYFYGAEAYNNGPSEINRICEELYSNSEYGKARGMTIEDVNDALNNPLEAMQLGGMYVDDEDRVYTTGNLTTKLRDLPIWNSIKTNGTYTPDGVNTEEALGEYELNGYMYGVNDDGTALINPVNGETYNITAVEKNVIFGGSYWLASLGVSTYYGCAIFGQGRVYGGSVASCSNFFYSLKDREDGNSAGLRPVVSLKYQIPEINAPL